MISGSSWSVGAGAIGKKGMLEAVEKKERLGLVRKKRMFATMGVEW